MVLAAAVVTARLENLVVVVVVMERGALTGALVGLPLCRPDYFGRLPMCAPATAVRPKGLCISQVLVSMRVRSSVNLLWQLVPLLGQVSMPPWVLAVVGQAQM